MVLLARCRRLEMSENCGEGEKEKRFMSLLVAVEMNS